MPKENKTKYAVLGMLWDKHMTGYEIQHQIVNKMLDNWSEGFNSIYPCLKKLTSENLVKSSTTERPNVVTYTITSQGKELLKHWLNQTDSTNLIRNEELLKIFFSNNIDSEQFNILINKVRQESELQLDKMLKRNLSDNQGSEKIIILYNISMLKAKINWCKLMINNQYNLDKYLI
ncbi:PadR family transcriptional regulator [bacterium SCSIO 12844]|nr:PadR family transcriptional regulator [bacterium SCSIO 12844]